MRIFTVTEQHLKLLGRICFGYNEYAEFGAPEVDPKRPYGNSDVYGDIAEIIGLEPEGAADSWGDREFTDDQKDSMLTLHKDMQYILQILAKNRGIEAGTYESTRYGTDWKKVT